MPDQNKNSISWTIPEYAEHERSKRWYIIALSLLGVLVVSSLFSGNFIFALILIIGAVIMALHDRNKADELECLINDDGVHIGRQTYSYSVFKNFWLYYEPSENKMLFLEFKSGVRPRLAMPLLDANPLKVRTLLLGFLPEDTEKENEPLSEQLSRLLKL